MIKMFTKRMNNRKGFTLIELIVVIAILGILALIAIPRFGGFTDRAKKQADEQYGAIVGNSVFTLLAAGDLEFDPTVTNTTVASGTAVHATVRVVKATGAIDNVTLIRAKGGSATIAEATLNTEVAKLVANKPMQHFATVTITISRDGIVSVVGAL